MNTLHLTFDSADAQVRVPARIRRWADLRWLASARLFVATAGTGLLIVVLQQLSLAAPPSAIVAASVCAAAMAFALVNPRRTRLVVLNLFAMAFTLRLAALSAFYMAAVQEGGPFLGPDSLGYLEGARELVRRDFALDSVPPTFFGTYNLSAFYFFAAPVWLLEADLFALQTLNAGVSALAAPVIYAIGRETLPRGARLLGLAVALYPSLIVLSVVDLLKDPSIMCATLLAVWAILRLMRTKELRSIVAPAAVALIALLYLRTGRFYTAAYLEVALAGTLIWARVFRGTRAFRLRAASLALLLIVLACELVPAMWRWPPTPLLYADQVARVLGSPGFWFRTSGLFSRFQEDHEPFSLALLPVNIAKRLIGPFPWIAPEEWTLRTLQTGDYLLYPGMLIWYAMLPLVIVGLVSVGAGLRNAPALRPPVVLVWLFAVPYLLQYLILNLSYRQREVMIPLFALFAWIGLVAACSRGTFPRWYRLYWVSLFVLAAAHLIARALFVS